MILALVCAAVLVVGWGMLVTFRRGKRAFNDLFDGRILELGIFVRRNEDRVS